MFKILFAIFVPGPITPGIEVITKLDVGTRKSYTLTPGSQFKLVRAYYLSNHPHAPKTRVATENPETRPNR
jgi:hypothetical protein